MCVAEAPLRCAGISGDERAALEFGQSSAAGVGALVVAVAAGALTAATAGAALSCEALEAQVPVSACWLTPLMPW